MTTKTPGAGLDLGTMNIIAARRGETSISHKRIRDAFLDLEPEAKRSLKMSNVDYFEKDGALFVIGDSALNIANLFKREVRRPLSRGVIASGEIEAQEILSLLVEHVIGKPAVDREHCFYSVPAPPIDEPGQDVVFHTEIFRRIISELGFAAHPMNEAMAIVFSQCGKENFSGLAVSFGSGMANVALAYQANCGLQFSLARGGDYVDQQSARAIGKTAGQMCAIKEKGIDLRSPKGREEQAIALYVRSLISYCLQNLAKQFRKVQSEIELPGPIPFIVSGGTSKAGGFLEIFEEEFESIRRRFPIQVSEIRHASDPLTAVADGLLVLATEEHQSS